MTSPAPGGACRRGLQVTTALTAVLLVAALARGVAVGAPEAGPAPSAAGHHGSVPATTASTTTVPADGRVVHDHGALEVTVMLGEDGETRVQGPVRPGAYISFVNHTTADQVLTSEDGTITVDVPLVRLVTVQSPTTPGTYRLVSATDSTVAAELVVAP